MIGGLLFLSYGASLNPPLTIAHSSFLFSTPEIILIISLICMILGAGFLRISISSMVSELYQEESNFENQKLESEKQEISSKNQKLHLKQEKLENPEKSKSKVESILHYLIWL